MLLMKRRRVTPTIDQLERMLNTHLSFEINRFTRGVELWRKKVNGDGSVDEMVLEACLIHLRLLLDFFYPRNGTEEDSPYSDIFVTDYIPTYRYTTRLGLLLSPTPEWVPEYRSRLDWQVAQLTMKRDGIETEHPWHHWKEIQPLFIHMEKLVEAFLQALPPNMKAGYDPMRGWPGSDSTPQLSGEAASGFTPMNPESPESSAARPRRRTASG